MTTAPILEYLKEHGQQLDSEIALAMGVPLHEVQVAVSDLLARGQVFGCSVTRFNEGDPVHGMLYRVAGFIPRTGPGRKPGPKI